MKCEHDLAAFMLSDAHRRCDPKKRVDTVKTPSVCLAEALAVTARRHAATARFSNR
jgi:hypothetical protein